MKIKTLAITLYQKDNGGPNTVTDENIQIEINKKLEEAKITTENMIDIKVNTQFFDWSQCNDAWSPSGTMVVWSILVIYKV